MPKTEALEKRFISLVDSQKEQFCQALAPATRNESEYFIRACVAAIRKNSNLQRCTMPSVVESIMQAGALGLVPNTLSNECALIPYGSECTLQVMYQGFITLAARAGIEVLIADRIAENDHYELRRGTNPELIHTIDLARPRGATIAYYCTYRLPSGTNVTYILELDKYNKIRDAALARIERKAGPKAVQNSPYTLWPDEMGCSKAIKHALKNCPNKGRELATAIELDTQTEVGKRERNITAEARIIVPDGEDVPAAKVPTVNPKPEDEGAME